MSGACLLVAVLPDGSRVPAVRSMFAAEADERASTFSDPDAAARFAVEVLRALGVVATLDIEPLPVTTDP